MATSTTKKKTTATSKKASPKKESPKKAPVKAAPAKKAPAKKAPVKAAPVKAAPAKKAPVKAAPAKKAPVKKAPAKKAPAKKAPAKAAPAAHSHDKLAPAAHRHDEKYASKKHNHAWPEIVGKPKAFPPGSHEHKAGSHAHEGLAQADHAHAGIATKAELKTLATRVGRLETEPRPTTPAAAAGAVIGGKLDTQPIDGSPSFSPTYPFKFDISRLGKNLDPHRLRVVANGFKKAADDHPESTLMIRWSLEGTALLFHVWDANGNECGVASPTPFGWYNKRVELSFLAFYDA